MKLLPLLLVTLLGACSSIQPDLPVNIFDEAQFSGADPVDIGSVAPVVNRETLGLLPRTYEGMDKHQATGWASKLDFSGVSLNDASPATRRTATLIHPQYVIMATHYAQPVGAKVRWKTIWGSIVERTIAQRWSMTGADITLAKLDQPTEGLATYAILPSGYKWTTALKSCFSIHTDQEGKALVKAINGGVTAMDHQDDIAGRIYYKALGGKIGAYGDERLITGDSGNPFFITYGGQLVLLGVHWTTASATFISDPDVIAWVRRTIGS